MKIQPMQQIADHVVRAEMDRVHLSYRWRVTGGEFQDVEETVRIVRAPCRFGGSRP
jgi:hypothetical protein